MHLEKAIFQQIKAILTTNTVAALATIGVESKAPQVALVYFLYDNQDGIFFATLEESRKLHNLNSNASVALVVGGESNKQVIQIEGTTHVIDDRAQRVKILSDINRKIAPDNTESGWPLLRLGPTDIFVLRVTIEWLRFSSFENDRIIIEAKGRDLTEHLGK